MKARSDDNVRGETGVVETDDAVNAVLSGTGENAQVERMIVQRNRMEERNFMVLFVRVCMRDRACQRWSEMTQIDVKRKRCLSCK